MIEIQMRSIILITISFVIIVCCKCQSDGSSISFSDSLSSFKHGNFHIEIYEHINNQKVANASGKKYFYSPIALLDHKSANSTYNRVTKKHEMRFRIEMWNDEVENKVVIHLNKIVGQEIQSDKVRVIPFEKVILTSNVPETDYSLSPVWTHYDKSKTLRLSLSCYEKKICDELADEMRSNPEHFDHLKLLYSFSQQTSLTKETRITFDSVTSGRMVANLLRKYGEDQNEIFLTDNDEKKILAETATNIRMYTFNDSEIGSPDTDIQIYNVLKDLLFETSKTTIKEQNDTKWDSVFWNEENYRPNTATTILNEIINHLDKENQKELANMFQKAERKSLITENLSSSNKTSEEEIQPVNGDQTAMDRNQSDAINQAGERGLANNQLNEKNRYKEVIQHNYNASSWTDVDRIISTISAKIANNSDGSRTLNIFIEDFKKLLHQDSRNHVQWDGDKFVPKPMKLSRINLGKFRDAQSFEDRKVRVRYMNAEQSVPIKFVEHAGLTVTDEWNDLKKELNATIELLNTTKENLVKTASDLNVLTIKFNENQRELNNTKTELAKTIDTFSNNVTDLSDKLNATEFKLTETNINAMNLSLELKDTIQKSEKNLRDDLNISRDDFIKKLNENSQRLTSEVEAAKDNIRGDLNATLKQLGNATQNLNVARTEFNSMKLAYENSKKNFAEYSQQLGKEQKVNEDKIRNELKETLKQLDIATKNVNETIRTELSSTKSTITDLKNKLNARTNEIVDIGKMPTSCSDLQRMGHKLSGFFSVKGLKKMEMVHCDFNPNQNVQQKLIGYADIKSASVHFYVQRSSSFSSNDSPILFDSALVNEGNAMDLKTGIFTAPQPGTYFFSFTGLMQFASSSSRIQFAVGLYLNRKQIGRGSVDEGNIGENPNDQVTLQSMLKLEKGDEVFLKMNSISGGAFLFDDNNHHTHFTGFMLEEEGIVSTL